MQPSLRGHSANFEEKFNSRALLRKERFGWESKRLLFVRSSEFLAFLARKRAATSWDPVNLCHFSYIHAYVATLFARFRKFHCKSLCAIKRFSFKRTWRTSPLFTLDQSRSPLQVKLSKGIILCGTSSSQNFPLGTWFLEESVKSSEIVSKTLHWLLLCRNKLFFFFFRLFEGKELFCALAVRMHLSSHFCEENVTQQNLRLISLSIINFLYTRVLLTLFIH